MSARIAKVKKGLGTNVQKALRVGAAYGVLASGAYGTFSTVLPREAQAQEEPVKEEDSFVWDWSDSKTYEAQTKFLKLVYGAYQQGDAPVKKFVAAVNESYVKAREDLGKMFDGQMDEKVTTLELVCGEAVEDSSICLTISYKPNAGSKLAGHSTVMVKYLLETHGDNQKKVTVVAWQGFNDEKKAWEDIKVPDEMQPTIKKKTEGKPPSDCSYPRWNPGGKRYGFISPRKLGK